MIAFASLRRLIALTLALCLLLTSGAMAVARSHAETGSLMVICSGKGYVTIEIGADGEPIEAAHICPDCVLSLVVDVDTPSALPAQVIFVGLLEVGTPAQLVGWRTKVQFSARAPPALV